VIVTDARGLRLTAVDEVRVELDRAEVRLNTASEAWRETFAIVVSEQVPAHLIRSVHNQKLHWHGPVRLVCV
jgi:hypothetical protein